MPPQDPRTPGLVGSNIQSNSAVPDNETLRHLHETTEERANRLHDELTNSIGLPTPSQITAQRKGRARVCRNTQKIGDTVFKCMAVHNESDDVHGFGPQHEERGRVVKEGVTTRYLMQWWDVETEVIR